MSVRACVSACAFSLQPNSKFLREHHETGGQRDVSRNNDSVLCGAISGAWFNSGQSFFYIYTAQEFKSLSSNKAQFSYCPEDGGRALHHAAANQRRIAETTISASGPRTVKPKKKKKKERKLALFPAARKDVVMN